MAGGAMKITPEPSAPILCFGGPYSNLQAMVAMRREAERLAIPPGNVICTGDVVAYCANPNETVDVIREWGCHTIKGNCEEQLAERADDCGCGFGDGTACDLLSQRWYEFANDTLGEAQRAWVAGLPSTLTCEISGRSVRVIHGGVSDISRFIFASTPAGEKLRELDDAAADIVIAGHCGIPFTEKIDDRIWFNPGVIGMPANDGTRDGWYGLIETDRESGELHFRSRRLRYDAASASSALERSGHAEPYAEALMTGTWPSLDVLPRAERAATGQHLVETSVSLSAKSH